MYWAAAAAACSWIFKACASILLPSIYFINIISEVDADSLPAWLTLHLWVPRLASYVLQHDNDELIYALFLLLNTPQYTCVFGWPHSCQIISSLYIESTSLSRVWQFFLNQIVWMKTIWTDKIQIDYRIPKILLVSQRFDRLLLIFKLIVTVWWNTRPDFRLYSYSLDGMEHLHCLRSTACPRRPHAYAQMNQRGKTLVDVCCLSKSATIFNTFSGFLQF